MLFSSLVPYGLRNNSNATVRWHFLFCAGGKHLHVCEPKHKIKNLAHSAWSCLVRKAPTLWELCLRQNQKTSRYTKSIRIDYLEL
jgi:hypothetical protein